MGIAGSQLSVIDLQNGKLGRITAGFFDSIVCLPPNEVVGLNNSEAVWFSSGKNLKRSIGWSPQGVLNNTQIAVSYRFLQKQTSTMFQWHGPLLVGVESLEDSRNAFNQMALSANLFPSLGEGPDDFLESIPIRLLKDHKLLIAAGFAMTRLEQEKPWGLFLIDLQKRNSSPLGPIRKGDEDLSLFVKLTRFAATEDGEIIAGSSGKGIVLMNSKDAKEISRIPLQEVREVQKLALNDDGTILAAGLTSKDGQGRVEIFDVARGKTLWRTEYAPGVIYGLEFLADDSLVILQSGSGNNTVSRRKATDGKILWLVHV